MASRVYDPMTVPTPELRGDEDRVLRRVVSSHAVVGTSVRNTGGEDLGSIEEIMVDTSRGAIAYAVLSFGGFLGIGTKLFAIPWEALTYDTSHQAYVLNVDKHRLENAPGFDKDNWPDMADPAFGTKLFDYYGYRPYWER
jgi:sporulation protein YlmC with PRC-barrel domain